MPRSHTFLPILLASAVFAGNGAASLFSASADPYIAYVYPAGGQCGTTIRIDAGGQNLRNAGAVIVSGEGVRGRVAGYVGASGPLDKLQQEELARRLQEIAKSLKAGKQPSAPTAAPANASARPLPDLPELRDLERKTPQELAAIRDRFLNPAKRPKPPMAETASLEIEIERNAAPGNRELRLVTPFGITAPIMFQVGEAIELRERGPLDPANTDASTGPTNPRPPLVFNGRIMSGEEDAFEIALTANREIVFAVQARNLIPYIADAVPGWFQPTITLVDPAGRECAYEDDNGADPDPVLRFTPRSTGTYRLIVRDAIFRGREDFVYRLYAFGEPEAARQFPSGSRIGAPIAKGTRLEVDRGGPILIDGCIDAHGEKERHRVEYAKGERVHAEVIARRTGSPLDARLTLRDGTGKAIAENDDFSDPALGLWAHHADSRIVTAIPSDGAYFWEITDASGRGGTDFYYTLSAGPAKPDFELLTVHSAVNLAPGATAELEVRAIRRDGWNGEIRIGAAAVAAPSARGGAADFVVSEATIPAGADKALISVTAPAQGFTQPRILELNGTALIEGKEITRRVQAADLRMQAFGNTHLVPAGALYVAPRRKGGDAR